MLSPRPFRPHSFFPPSFAGLLLVVGTAAAAPTYTSVNPPPGSEANHLTILQMIYGGTWSPSGVRDFTNGTYFATRMADEGGGTLSINSVFDPTKDDRQWSGSAHSLLSMQARYAGDLSTLGWFDDTQASPTFQPLLSTSAIGASATVDFSALFRLALRNNSTGLLFTSRTTDNPGATDSSKKFDQLVTYSITGGSGGPQWALFWEDRINGQSSDYDYNDAVFTMSVIPAPGTALIAGAAGLGFLGARARRRSIARRHRTADQSGEASAAPGFDSPGSAPPAPPR